MVIAPTGHILAASRQASSQLFWLQAFWSAPDFPSSKLILKTVGATEAHAPQPIHLVLSTDTFILVFKI
jgi:hypothetical protein